MRIFILWKEAPSLRESLLLNIGLPAPHRERGIRLTPCVGVSPHTHPYSLLLKVEVNLPGYGQAQGSGPGRNGSRWLALTTGPPVSSALPAGESGSLFGLVLQAWGGGSRKQRYLPEGWGLNGLIEGLGPAVSGGARRGRAHTSSLVLLLGEHRPGSLHTQPPQQRPLRPCWPGFWKL